MASFTLRIMCLQYEAGEESAEAIFICSFYIFHRNDCLLFM